MQVGHAAAADDGGETLFLGLLPRASSIQLKLLLFLGALFLELLEEDVVIFEFL